MTERSPPSQAVQRVRVGLIGLAAVVLLIALASAILGSATRDRSTTGPGSSNLVAEIASGNAAAPAAGEPLAEMGVAPGTAPAATANGSAAPN